MASVLFVRIRSELDVDEFDRRLLERRFESDVTLAAFRESKLASTIPTAYEATEVRREIYDVLYPLRPERGPLAEAQAASADP